MQSHTPTWQCETRDSAEGHDCNLDYFRDERDTNCVGQLEQRLWAGVDLMSKQQPGKLTMHTTPRPTPYNCSRITACTVCTAALNPPDYSVWHPGTVTQPWLSAVCIFDSFIKHVSLCGVSAAARQRQTHVHLLYLAIKAILIDERARN